MNKLKIIKNVDYCDEKEKIYTIVYKVYIGENVKEGLQDEIESILKYLIE